MVTLRIYCGTFMCGVVGVPGVCQIVKIHTVIINLFDGNVITYKKLIDIDYDDEFGKLQKCKNIIDDLVYDDIDDNDYSNIFFCRCNELGVV